MNGGAHANIMIGAVEVQPATLREQLTTDYELLRKAGNYPDYFDDPSGKEEDKQKIDPEWKRFCRYPDSLAAQALHFWPGNIRDQTGRIPLLEYLLGQMLDCRQCGDISGFIKFSGCLSHYFGDATQPAHLNPESDSNFIDKLLPVPDRPEEFGDFHYHTTLESITGICEQLSKPEIQGTTVPEIAWRLARRCRSAIDYCTRFIVPLTQALFSGDYKCAVKAASEPVTIAAQLTADAIYTIDAIARNSFTEDEAAVLVEADLRILPPDRQFHDLVYSGVVIDGNKDVPPYTVPITPGMLRFSDGIKTLKGLGMLPHSGMNGPRECYMSWNLPVGVFRRFTAQVGLHAELAVTGAVAFQVLLDDKEVWNSGRMTYEDIAKDIDLNIENADSITLKVSDANKGTSFWENHAFWANPQLLKK